MSGQVRTILDQDGLKVTRHDDDRARDRTCEHRLNREGGYGDKLNAARKAVEAVAGVSHAYTSPMPDGWTIFYGLTDDKPGQYLPVARRVVSAVQAVL
jgi:hypothetical protein